jgi:hypothetical protein
METINSYEGWIGRDAYDINGDKIGGIDQIYYDDITGRPEWLAIRTGFFGTNTSFAPISGSTVYGDDLRLAYTKDQVKDAPNIDPTSGSLLAHDEQVLFDHYGFASDARRYGDDERFDRDYTVDTERMRGDVAETTRSEEQLRVGTETVPTGKARLRKYVVTEHQNVRRCASSVSRSPMERLTTSVMTRQRSRPTPSVRWSAPRRWPRRRSVWSRRQSSTRRRFPATCARSKSTSTSTTTPRSARANPHCGGGTSRGVFSTRWPRSSHARSAAWRSRAGCSISG